MDIIGPLPITTQGNKYIITLTDCFSKWAEASPLSDKTAASVSKLLFKVCLYSHIVSNSLNYIISVYLSSWVS